MRGKKAIINIISSLVLQFVIVICGFIVPRLIMQSFGSSVNGLVASITQFLSYITLLESGFGPVVKAALYKPIAEKNQDEIKEILKASENFFRIISYIFIIYIIILCFVLPYIVSSEFDKTYTLSLVVIISVSTFAEYYFGMTYRLYIQAEQKTYIISFIQIATLIINTITIVILIKIGASIQIVKLASSSIFVLRPVIQNIYVKRKYNLKIGKTKSQYKIKQRWDGLGQHIASVVHNNTDVVILTAFLNTLEVSVYTVYLMVVNGVKNMVQALTGGIDASFGDMIAKGEKDILNRSFKAYEDLYFTIATIIFIVTLFSITPFVSVYTQGISDVNYYRPAFAYLIVLAEFIWIIRLPYSGITLAAGHFKETRLGAWVEAILNIVISIILVNKLGIVGVAIGTMAAMIIRTIEFMYHTSKYILERNVWYTFKRCFVIMFEVILTLIVLSVIKKFNIDSYIIWAIYAVIIASIAVIVVIPINCIVYRDNLDNVLSMVKKLLRRV